MKHKYAVGDVKQKGTTVGSCVTTNDKRSSLLTTHETKLTFVPLTSYSLNTPKAVLDIFDEYTSYKQLTCELWISVANFTMIVEKPNTV